MSVQIIGVINYTEDDSGNNIQLINDWIDLSNCDLIESISGTIQRYGNFGRIRVWVSDKPSHKENMKDGYFKTIDGTIICKYEDNKGILIIGDFDLYEYLACKHGQFVIIEFLSHKLA